MSANPQPLSRPAPAAAVDQPLRHAGDVSVSGPRELTLRFNGSAAEYFRIWIVNTCLSLLTLGIFSAWAKVRKKRYFYSHTVLDGTPFQYLGQPLPILKGRIIATALLGVWYVGTHFVLELIPIVLILAFVLAPWVLVRSAAFNARYSAFRNMTFEFKGSYWSAVKVLYGWGLITIVTFGFGFSWWQQRIKQYMITRWSYGGVAGEFSAKGRQFFRIYLIVGLLFGGTLGAIGGVAAVMFARGATSDGFSLLFALTAVSYVLYVAAFAYIQAKIGNLVWNSTQLGPLTFRSTLSARGLLKLYITNLIAIVASVGLLIPWATVRMQQYRITHFAVTADSELSMFEGSPASSVQAAGAEVGDFFDFDMSI